MERRGAFIACDRCGKKSFGEIVAESCVGVPQYPAGWRPSVHVMGRVYNDLCPECAAEYERLTREWWDRGAKAREERGEL